MTKQGVAGARSDIAGFGLGIPDRIMTNADLEKIVDTSDEWIITRTGIRERRIAPDDVNVSDLAAEAGLDAIADAGLSAEDIDLIVVATGSPELIWPSTACLTQTKLGLDSCPAFDLQAACSGFTYGMTVADGLIASGVYKTVLLIGAEVMSRFVDWKDRGTCVLFGDGAGAVVLRPAREGYGVKASVLGARGSGSDLLLIPAGGSGRVCSAEVVNEEAQMIRMKGNEVYRFAVKILPENIEAVVAEAGLTLGDVDHIIPHQANQRIIEVAAERMGIERDKIISNIAKYGNTSAASIPIALAELDREGRLKPGDIIITVAFGAGLTWGANLLRWGGKEE